MDASLSHATNSPNLTINDDEGGSPSSGGGGSNSRQSRTVHRVSLACMQCRSRHMKCDAQKPYCSRCTAEGILCTYAKSRRRGHRRTKVSEERGSAHQSDVGNTGLNIDQRTSHRSSISISSPMSSSSGFGPSHTLSSPNTDASNPSMGAMMGHRGGLNIGRQSSHFGTNSGSGDDLLGLYYNFFHKAHPCVLPRWPLERHFAADPLSFNPLILVMQYIGSRYSNTVSSDGYRDLVAEALPIGTNSELPATPHQVQALLLYAIAIYWCDEAKTATNLIGKVIHRAKEFHMHQSSFAMQHSRNDPLLEESWRRTWWLIYITEGHIAGLTRQYPTRIGNVTITTMLPCEEEAYESGNIPPPRSLQEYDMREFLPDGDPGFSSFAHLIGLIQVMNLILTRYQPTPASIAIICNQCDISVSAWCSLLPSSKRGLLTVKREFDSLLFMANMMINTFIVNFHRQLSMLAYSSIESVAYCAPPPPHPDLRRTDGTHIHTHKALLAIRRMNDLIPVTSDLLALSPFTIGMIASTMVAHLSACRYLFRGQALQLERERIRASMGVLRVLGDVWPLGERTYREMGTIAKELLYLGDKDGSMKPVDHPIAASEGAGTSSSQAIIDPITVQSWLPDMGGYNDESGYFDFQGLTQELLGDSYHLFPNSNMGVVYPHQMP